MKPNRCSWDQCRSRDPATAMTHPNPVTRQIMAPEAGLIPRSPPSPPPPPGDGLGGDCLFLPSHDPEPAWNAGRPGTHSPSSAALLKASVPRYRQSTPPLTSVSRGCPPTSAGSASVRARKEGGRGKPEGAARGRGSHACNPEGPRAKGAVRKQCMFTVERQHQRQQE
ncbi:nck-associated protein 5-like isoform X1 [Cebus imitator]|uniref:nck-associated protein 5-like isoform X1 n=1 Tax=Cebus imitator TaxID=2715852 RepID=UPI00189AAEEF|nr:nck-associated protein 5-like isoform X1 [Cebus imitator]